MIRLLLLIVVLASCQKQEGDIYEIKKGEHRCNKVSEVLYNNTLTYKVIFDSSCIYKMYDEDMYDVNKCFGIGENNIHDNSNRIGWNTLNTQKIYLYAYVYEKGEREIYLIDSCNVMEEVTMMVAMTDYYIVNVRGVDKFKKKRDNTAGVYYKLLPYFGGTKTAPKNMKISLK